MKFWPIPSLLALLSVALAAAPLAGQQRLLETHPVSSSSDLNYQLVNGEPCDENVRFSGGEGLVCQTRVVLLNGNQELGSEKLDFGLFKGMEPVKDEEGCWVTRVEGLHLEACPSVVRLKSDLNGLMVTQTVGWDHVAKGQELYVALGDSLAKVWTQGAGGGLEWESAWVTDVDGDGVDEIVSLNGLYSWLPEEGQDVWQLTTLAWDGTSGKMKEVAELGRRQPAYAAIVGSYETLIEARQQHEELGRMEDPIPMIKTSCLTAFHVYRSAAFPQLRPGWFIIANLSTDRADVEAELEEAEACSPAIDGYIRRAY